MANTLPTLPMKYHNLQVVLIAWISMTLFRHPSPSTITLGKLSRLHAVSAWSRWIYVFSGLLILLYLCVEVHRRRLFMSLSLLLQLWSVFLGRLCLNVLWDGRWDALQLLFCWVLLPGSIAVIVSAWYCLLLAFFDVKQFSFISAFHELFLKIDLLNIWCLLIPVQDSSD